MTRFAIASLALFALGTSPVFAADPAAAPGPWSGDVSAGYVATSGNSSTRSTNAKAQGVYASAAWRNTSDASALNSSQTDPLTGVKVRTAERYSLGNKTDFNFTERDYAFLALEADKDLFGPVRDRTSETIGYGRKILTGPEHTLDAELGGGWRQTKAQGTGEKASDAIGRARVAYKWSFGEASHFGQTAKVESGESNTFVESVTELKVTLVDKLFATAAYTLRNNSDVPPGAKKTDTITTFGLGWSFGK